MVRIRALTLVVTTGIQLGCSSTPSAPSTALSGNFIVANPWPGGPGFYLGLSLTVHATDVSGIGWLGGTQEPIALFSISGQFTDPSFALDLMSRTGAPAGNLNGTTAGAAIQATLTIGIGTTPTQVVFTRVDTSATGLQSTTITGAVSEQVTASAYFGQTQIGSFVISLAYPNRSYPVVGLARQGARPSAGTYALAVPNGFGGTIVPAYAPSQRFFTVSSGVLRLDVSTAFALIGQLTLEAEESGTGARISVTSTFSAACVVEICQ